MVEVVLNKIKIDENRNEQIIVLKEKNGNRLLPVVIGISEVNAIKLKLSGIDPPRPLTHDLLLRVIEGFGGQVKRILIDRLEDSTFYAKLVLTKNGSTDELQIDARPSDSIALALRANAPIVVNPTVLDEAGINGV
ncbi:MAG: bifunctional nuclease family protein [Candidatus Omnitrophica bacterium]|nr:bifunctional nuclease family protein [Candidatus Omnitrophota bacterium]